MKSKWQLYSAILLFTLILLLTGFITYGWIIATFKSDPIIVETGTLDLDYQFSIANDANRDGITDGGYTVITTGGLSFEQVIPGMVYTYKLELTNNGSIDGALDITLKDIAYSSGVMNEALIIQYIHPVTTLPVQAFINDANEIIVTDYVLESLASYVFEFTITVNPELGNTSQGESVLIPFIELKLDQII